jgi:hypothetical protein
MFASLTSYLSNLLEHITTQGLTAAAALAAAFLGPIAAIVVGRRQVRATVLSVNRQAWINALREDVAEVLEKRIEHSQLFRPHLAEGLICTDPTKADEIMERIRFLGYRIQLRLNPGETEHDGLVHLLKKAPAPPSNPNLTAEIVAATQAILRKEWKRAAKAK